MDAQGAVEHRRTLLAGLAGRVLEVGAGNGLNLAHTRQPSQRPWPWNPSRICVVLPRSPPAGRRSWSGWSTAPPTTSRPRRAAWTPWSPPWRCARCPGRPVLWKALSGAAAWWGAALLRARPSRHRRPGPGPATRRPHLAHPGGRLPHQPRHPGRHHHRRLPDHEPPAVPVPREPATPTSRTPPPRGRPRPSSL
jgi:hypothetical protein